MKRIEEIDKNFNIKDVVLKEGTRMYNVCHTPFSIHGLFPPLCSGDSFFRIPAELAEHLNENVKYLRTYCAGGRVRFKTDSSYIAVKAIMGKIGRMSRFALTGSAGFDLYSGTEHIITFQPKLNMTEELIGECNTGSKMLREYTLNLPLWSEVKELYIILDEEAVVEKAEPYKNDKPIVFYGSSITQGGCASRPGNAYPAILSRRLGFDYINLGFSGNACGERAMADYIASLDMCAFVFDYDHNAPSAEHLLDTHEPFLKIIRQVHPFIPVICMSQPIPNSVNYAERREIIKKSVMNAKASGDKNIYFIDMIDYLDKKGVLNEASVDRCHPNDLGFYFMAKALGEVMKGLV